MGGFKSFVMRGNVVDLAVGVVIGAAFGTVVTSLVTDIMTPLIAALFAQPDFSQLAWTVNGSAIKYGNFINSLVSFLVVTASIYFFVVLPLNKMMARIGMEAKIEGK